MYEMEMFFPDLGVAVEHSEKEAVAGNREEDEVEKEENKEDE